MNGGPGNTERGLEVVNLRKKMPAFQLQADFVVLPKERAAVLGPSGSGKTTLFRLLAGLETADAGQVFLGTKNLLEQEPRAREIGFVFQDHALFPALNVAENVAFGLRMRGVKKEERREEAEQWLSRVGLKGRADSSVQELSVGERGRVAFLRAIVWKPRLLLFDEPFAALDLGLRAQLRSELVELHRAWPVPLLLVTHDEGDVAALAATVLRIRDEAGVRRIRK